MFNIKKNMYNVYLRIIKNNKIQICVFNSNILEY